MHQKENKVVYPRGITKATQQDEILGNYLLAILDCDQSCQEFRQAVKEWFVSKDWYLDKR